MDGMNIKPGGAFGPFPFQRSVWFEDDLSLRLRVARLDSEVRHIDNSLIDIRQDIRELRSETKEDISKLEEKMSMKFDSLQVKFESFQKWLVGILLSSFIIPIVVASITSMLIRVS